MDAEELMSSEFPQPPWAVEGLITEGFHTFAGREKTGKSFLTLQLAKAVSEGSSRPSANRNSSRSWPP